jgi:hypothetical protein
VNEHIPECFASECVGECRPKGFNVETDAILHGSMNGAHGQPGGLRWAWICEDDIDIILFHDEPRHIYGAIRCGEEILESREDCIGAIEGHYLCPPIDYEKGCSMPVFGPTGWDSRASEL